MGIYRRYRIMRWIEDVILIHLGTFKPMDGRHVCPGDSTWVFDMWSIFIGIINSKINTNQILFTLVAHRESHCSPGWVGLPTGWTKTWFEHRRFLL